MKNITKLHNKLCSTASNPPGIHAKNVAMLMPFSPTFTLTFFAFRKLILLLHCCIFSVILYWKQHSFLYFLAIAIKKIACDAAYNRSCTKRHNFLYNTINRSNCCLKEPILSFASKRESACITVCMCTLRFCMSNHTKSDHIFVEIKFRS